MKKLQEQVEHPSWAKFHQESFRDAFRPTPQAKPTELGDIIGIVALMVLGAFIGFLAALWWLA